MVVGVIDAPEYFAGKTKLFSCRPFPFRPDCELSLMDVSAVMKQRVGPTDVVSGPQ